MTELLIHSGKLKGRKLELPAGDVLIGRDESCQIRLASTDISRQHCRLRCGPDGIHVSDLGSRNGTYVNNALIQHEVLLKPGDLVRVGPLELLFPGEAVIPVVPAVASPAMSAAVSPAVAATNRAFQEAGPEDPVPSPRRVTVAEKTLSESAKANRGSGKVKKATDDDIASWLSDDDSVNATSPGDTTIIPGVKKAKDLSEEDTPPPASKAVELPREASRKPKTVQEEAAEIIRRHHDNLKKKRGPS